MPYGYGYSFGFKGGGGLNPLAILGPSSFSFLISALPYAITGAELISFTDTKNVGGDKYTVTAVAKEGAGTEGTLTADATAYAACDAQSGNGTSTISVTGTLAQVNAVFADGGGIDLDAVDEPGVDTIAISFLKVGGGSVARVIPFSVLDIDFEATPGEATLTYTGYAPSGFSSISLVPDAAALAYTGYAPVWFAGITAVPDAAALTYTGYAPTALTGVVVVPGAAALSYTGYAPTVYSVIAVTPDQAALTYTGYAPTFEAGGLGADLDLNFLTATIGSDGAPIAD